MQIDRNAVNLPALREQRLGQSRRPVCLLGCDDCTGLCLPVYLMLDREEQAEMYRLHRRDRLVVRHRLC